MVKILYTMRSTWRSLVSTHTCLLTVTSPELGGWPYLAVDAYGQDTVHYEVHLEVFGKYAHLSADRHLT